MNKKLIKRGYNFSQELLDEWEKFHEPSGKDYSPSAAAAFLLYMVIEPAAREQLRKLACKSDIKKACLDARKLLRETIVDAYLTDWLDTFSEDDKALALNSVKQLAESLSRKK